MADRFNPAINGQQILGSSASEFTKFGEAFVRNQRRDTMRPVVTGRISPAVGGGSRALAALNGGNPVQQLDWFPHLQSTDLPNTTAADVHGMGATFNGGVHDDVYTNVGECKALPTTCNVHLSTAPSVIAGKSKQDLSGTYEKKEVSFFANLENPRAAKGDTRALLSMRAVDQALQATDANTVKHIYDGFFSRYGVTRAGVVQQFFATSQSIDDSSHSANIATAGVVEMTNLWCGRNSARSGDRLYLIVRLIDSYEDPLHTKLQGNPSGQTHWGFVAYASATGPPPPDMYNGRTAGGDPWTGCCFYVGKARATQRLRIPAHVLGKSAAATSDSQRYIHKMHSKDSGTPLSREQSDLIAKRCGIIFVDISRPPRTEVVLYLPPPPHLSGV